MKSDIIDLDMEILVRTEKAVLAHTGDKDTAVWFPLSQIEIHPTGFEGIVTISMPERLAVEKGIV